MSKKLVIDKKYIIVLETPNGRLGIWESDKQYEYMLRELERAELLASENKHIERGTKFSLFKKVKIKEKEKTC